MTRKCLLLLAPCSILLLATQGSAQYHRSYFKEPVPLELDSTRVALRLEDGAHSVSLGSVGPGLASPPGNRSPVPGWILADLGNPVASPQDLEQLLANASSSPDVAFVSPVFVGADGGPVVVTSTLLVRFEPGVPSGIARTLLAATGAGEILDEGWGGMPDAYRIASGLTNGLDVLAVSNTLAQLPEVRFAEPDMMFTGRGGLLPDDPLFDDCWGLHNIGQAGGTPDQDMDAPEAWDITTGDPSVIVVVIDTAVQQDHPDINQITGADVTSEGPGDGGPVNECDNHGTAVAGCISAIFDNSLGTVGVAPGCPSASARTFISNTSPCTGGWTSLSSWTVDALVFAESIGARVTCNSNDYGMTSAAIDSKYEQTRTDGMVHFAAAGNDGGFGLAYPAEISCVNAVCAVDRDGDLAIFSNFGTGLAFAAPGVEIDTTDRTGADGYETEDDFVVASGTSFATPYAAGVAALVLSEFPTATPDEVEGYLQVSAADLGTPGYDTTFGWGFINARGALIAPIPPTLTSLSVTTGAVRGENLVSLFGQDFDHSTGALFGQKTAIVVGRTGRTEITVEVPEGSGENTVVDVTVTQPGGTSTLPAAYTYLPNEPDLDHVSGLPTIGSTLRFDLFGEAGASCALLADGQLGSCVRGGLTLGLACTSRLRVVHNSFSGFGGTDEPLGILGRREVSFRIPDDPDLISRTFHVQGVVRDSGTGRAALVTTEVLSLTVLP